MVVTLEELFVQQLMTCPPTFREAFRKIYQQLRIVDFPTEVRGVYATKDKKFFKIIIEESKIGLHYNNHKALIICFLYNQYYQ